MITKTNGRMGLGKAAEPTGIIAEMLKCAGEAGVFKVYDLVEAIILKGFIPSNRELLPWQRRETTGIGPV